MSLQSASDFTNAIISNPALMPEVLKTIDGKNEAEASSAISALGKSKGYDFTPEEAVTLRHAALKQLSDADLDGVAGGSTGSTAAPIIGFFAGQVLGRGIPVGGTILGAGIGAGIGAALDGASAQDSFNAGTAGIVNTANQVKDGFEKVFSGW
jgi:hypothetical protein